MELLTLHHHSLDDRLVCPRPQIATATEHISAKGEVNCSVVKHLDTVNVVVCRVCNYGFAPYCANVLVPMFVHSYVLVYLVI